MKMVTLQIDDQTVTVPDGTLVVNAAKQAGIDIPVFCYHPKMEPVGMCRMCLVDIGRPVIDRATNQPVLAEDGTPKIAFGPKLDTACTVPVSEAMRVVTKSAKVVAARKEIVEFILTSHPLDCPVCDKGGECPLQNLTMEFGTAESRFLFDEKMHMAKHVALGDLIFLDRERCIQCARCVRFQSEVAGDPVIGFNNRGRSLEIVTHSDPGFDSYFSGNTTDICPVGALTTADFRFGARPWELKAAASLCNHCAVGCNTTINVRREARSGGKMTIKRIMPRQNEEVNEIWLCDKGRFVYNYTESPERLAMPLVRKDGELVQASWDEALQIAADGLKSAGNRLVVLAGGRLANEDLFNLRKLSAAQGGRTILNSYMAGGELTLQVGVGKGTNLGDLGKGDVILVAASDLHEEAPLWWLRLKQAAKRGAILIALGSRPTRLDTFAQHVLRCKAGEESEVLAQMLPGSGDFPESVKAAAEAFAGAANAIVFYGSDGLGLAGSAVLAQAAAELLVKTGHVGKANNGLAAVWPHGNTQGAWELGFTPEADLASRLSEAAGVLVAGTDPAGDDPSLARALDKSGFVVVQELFMTETARRADVVLPALAFTERDGTYTSGLRRAQRFYPAVTAISFPQLADFAITARLTEHMRMGACLEARAASLVWAQIAVEIPVYSGITYAALAETHAQEPVVGRSDMYYGGTGYDNHQGLGISLGTAAEHKEAVTQVSHATSVLPAGDGLLVVPATRLYDRGTLVLPTTLLQGRLAGADLQVNPALAEKHGLLAGQTVKLTAGGQEFDVRVVINKNAPGEAALLTRSTGVPILGPVRAQILQTVQG